MASIFEFAFGSWCGSVLVPTTLHHSPTPPQSQDLGNLAAVLFLRQEMHILIRRHVSVSNVIELEASASCLELRGTSPVASAALWASPQATSQRAPTIPDCLHRLPFLIMAWSNIL